MQHRHKILTIAALAAVAVAAAIVPTLAKPARGEMAPDFTGTTLSGGRVTLSEFRGKNPVVLNFFAEFCGPCRREFPHLRELDEKLGPKGLRVIAVSLDEDRRTAAVIPNMARAKFPVVFEPKGAIAAKYGVQAIPHTVVIDRTGHIHSVLVGLDPDRLDAAVEAVMK